MEYKCCTVEGAELQMSDIPNCFGMTGLIWNRISLQRNSLRVDWSCLPTAKFLPYLFLQKFAHAGLYAVGRLLCFRPFDWFSLEYVVFQKEKRKKNQEKKEVLQCSLNFKKETQYSSKPENVLMPLSSCSVPVQMLHHPKEILGIFHS